MNAVVNLRVLQKPVSSVFGFEPDSFQIFYKFKVLPLHQRAECVADRHVCRTVEAMEEKRNYFVSAHCAAGIIESVRCATSIYSSASEASCEVS